MSNDCEETFLPSISLVLFVGFKLRPRKLVFGVFRRLRG